MAPNKHILYFIIAVNEHNERNTTNRKNERKEKLVERIYSHGIFHQRN